jgi:hypothetical protein
MHVKTLQYDHQITNLIKTKFPQGLDGLYDDNNNLKLGTTALQAIQQVSKNIVDKTETTCCCMVLRTKIRSRRHTREFNGAINYFRATEQDQNMLVKLGSKRVPNHIVITAASVAFKECGYQKDLLGRAAIEWKAKAGDDLDSEATYEAFKVHWNENLKLIHLHSHTPKARANKAEDVSAIVDQAVASDLAAQASANEDMSQFLLGEQVALSRRMDDFQRTKEGIPSDIGTEGTALRTIETQNHTILRLQQELALARATTCPTAPPPSKQTSRGGGGRGEPQETPRNTPNLTDRPRRQWNKWFSSHGVNLHHGSDDCNREGPNHNKPATK